MAKLVLMFNAAVIKEYEIKKTTIAVGRKQDNDIIIDNPAVSSHHCKISMVGEEFFIEDLESTNGTYLNDKRIVKAGLKHNDVVGLATKHALVFVDEQLAPPPPPSDTPRKSSSEPTVALPPEKQEEMARAVQASAGKANVSETGFIQVIKGIVDKPSFDLIGLSTYIGKSDRVQIQIKGKGLFSSAPEVAASIHRKPEGYFLLAVKDGYPLVNGSRVSGQVLLSDGDIIECGATTMQFFSKKSAAGPVS